MKALDTKVLNILFILLIMAGCSDSNTEVLVDPNVIGEAGGSLASSDAVVSLTIPTGALAVDTEITFTPTTSHPAGAIGQVYDLGPDGLQFNSPVSITFKYAGLTFTKLENLSIAFVENDHWVLVATTMNTTNETLIAQIEHFTPFGIIEKDEVPINCKLTKIIQMKDGGDHRTTTFSYTAGRLKLISEEDNQSGETSTQTQTLKYNGDGALTLASQMDEGELEEENTFLYNEDGLLIKVSRKFYYDGIKSEEGEDYESSLQNNKIVQITVAETGPNSSNDSYTEKYEYNVVGNVETVLSKSGSNNFAVEHEITYDDKKNPFKSLGLPDFALYALIDDEGGLFSINNIISQSNPNDPEVTSISNVYTYNENGFPVTLTCNEFFMGSLVSSDLFTFEYECN